MPSRTPDWVGWMQFQARKLVSQDAGWHKAHDVFCPEIIHLTNDLYVYPDDETLSSSHCNVFIK